MSTLLTAELRAEAQEGRGQAARDGLLRTALGLGTGFSLLPLVIVIVYSFSSVSYGVFPPPGLSARWYWPTCSSRRRFARPLGEA